MNALPRLLQGCFAAGALGLALAAAASDDAAAPSQATAAAQAVLPGPEPQEVPPLEAFRRNYLQRTKQPMAASEVTQHAAAVLPYAMLSSIAYCNDIYRRKDPSPTAPLADAECEGGINPRDHGWDLMHTYDSDSGMENALPAGPKDLGLRFAVYYRTEGDAVHVGVAFRGTDFTSTADWHSNLRWFLPGRDQYDQVAAMVPGVIRLAKDGIQRKLAREVTRWHIVSTGHSLGGGLAQLFAYSSEEVEAAVVFDPSPVTAYYACVDDKVVHCNVPVWRIYEKGEVLAYLRSFTRLFYSLSENINEIEFNLLGGNIVANHSMLRFYKQLSQEVARRPLAADQFARLTEGHPDCHCSQHRRAELWKDPVKPKCEKLHGTAPPPGIGVDFRTAVTTPEPLFGPEGGR